MSQPPRFSRFEVHLRPDGTPHVLGEDAELTIYLAKDRESGTPAVLRVPGLAVQRNPAARHRFVEEAREMAAVNHPHIARVLRFGDTNAGAFCAMELCDGLTLQKAIEEVGALPWEEALRIALQISSALEELEKCGLVHRGLRPTNLIVTTGGDGHAHLKLTEYGRVSEEAIRDTLAATKSGFIRVPAYASPEEFLAVAPPDARSLQYALGAVLWFCLTAKPPFAGTQFEVMFQHVNKEPDWRALPSLPPPVLAVLKLLLAKSAGDRFASTAAASAALRSAMTGVTAGSMKAATLDAPTDGPTVLAWLKARQTLLLDEVHPLLARVADQMDAALGTGSEVFDTSLERVHLEVEGWSSLPEGQRAAMLRTPLIGWPRWRVKLAPGGNHETAASQTAGFIRFCHRLLTGQGKGTGRHIPTAALSEEGNAFFEKHLGTGAAIGVSCRGLLEQLCEAEDVALGAVDDVAADPLATRVVRSPSQPAQGPDAAPKQQAWLAREKEALERARRDLSQQEAERVRRMAEEQAHVERLRRSVEEQKAQLEEKRREQQRLEQELQLRAQLEFQKLQEEAKARESLLQHKRAAAEEALRKREEEFRAREQERFARLEKLKHENDAMEERVQQEYLTLRHVERRQLHLSQSTAAPPPSREAKSPTTRPSPPTTEPKPPTTSTTPVRTAPTAAGGIILARLSPVEIEEVPTPRQEPHRDLGHGAPIPSGTTTIRRRRWLVAVLIGLLIAGVLALMVAAALTIFTEGSFEEPQPAQVDAPPSPPPVPEVPQAIPVPKAPNPHDSLREMAEQVRTKPERRDALRPQALALVAAIAARPPEEAAPASETLRLAADTWKLPEAWLTLAGLEKDEDSRLAYYLQAARLGNVHAKSLAGRTLLEQGVRSGHGGTVQQAIAQLYDAVAGGDREAMMALGEALYDGRGPRINEAEGRALIERAAAIGHEPAKEWLNSHRK